jgi:hypothetical protein
MKIVARHIIMATVTGMIAAATTSAFAQYKVVTFDENGNGNYNNLPLPFALAVEPISGQTTLMYTLPFVTIPGDVQLFETPGVNPGSDIIRFDGQGHAFFFSDFETTDVPPFDLADGQLPPPIAALQRVFILENGPEGANGAVYTPGSTDPGFELSGPLHQYNIISDAVVPEPSTGLLAGLGGFLLWALRSRRTLSRN